MDHTIEIGELSEKHPFFSHAVKCSCGWTAYAVNAKQADEHKAFHEAEIPHYEARRVAGLAKDAADAKAIRDHEAAKTNEA